MDQVELEQLLASYPDMLTVNEVAAVLRVHPRSIQRWAHEGRVAYVRVGRSYRIPKTDVLRWMLAASMPAPAVSNILTPSEVAARTEEARL